MSKRYLDGVLVDVEEGTTAHVYTDAEKLDGIRQAREPLLQEADIAIFKLPFRQTIVRTVVFIVMRLMKPKNFKSEKEPCNNVLEQNAVKL